MAIQDGASFAVKVHAEDMSNKKPRRKKGEERPFCPPELALLPSRYNIAERLYQHYTSARNDAKYGLEWNRFKNEEKRKRLIDALKLAEKRALMDGKPRTARVRASELKNCARATAMDIMGFQRADVGSDSPHWNLAAVYGETVHEEVEVALLFLGLVKRSEFYLRSAGDEIGGMADILLDGSAFGEGLPDAILDIKSVGTDEFKKSWHGDKVRGYMQQISAYARINGNSVGVILLADRGSGKFEDCEFVVEPAHGDAMIKRAAIIIRFAEAKRLPKPEALDRGHKLECFMFCPFADICRRQQEDGSVQFSLDAGQEPKDIK